MSSNIAAAHRTRPFPQQPIIARNSGGSHSLSPPVLGNPWGPCDVVHCVRLAQRVLFSACLREAGVKNNRHSERGCQSSNFSLGWVCLLCARDLHSSWFSFWGTLSQRGVFLGKFGGEGLAAALYALGRDGPFLASVSASVKW